jgi:flavin-binding protein dodecin
MNNLGVNYVQSITRAIDDGKLSHFQDKEQVALPRL